MKNLLFVELNGTTTTIDGMAAGEFTDMLGRVVAFKKDELQQYVDNTKKALATTKDKNGVLVGFPIDAIGHEHGVAAGWVKDVELDAARNVITFQVEFNDLGKELIESNQLRYFSPEVDIRALVIRGGSLTNWPATRTKSQEMLLKPIALSESMFSLDGESLDEKVDSIRQAFYDAYAEWDWSTWPVEVFDEYLIGRKDDKYWQVKYSMDDQGEISFDPIENWVEVKRAWVEMALESFKKVFSGLFKQSSETNSDLEECMDFDKLPPEQQEKLLSQARTQVVAQMSTEATPELAALINARVNDGITAALALEQRKAHVAEFSARVVGGTTEKPGGLPVDQKKIEEVLLSLPEEQQKEVEAILGSIHEKGVVAFTEIGHSKPTNGNRELSAEIKIILQERLADGMTLETFFKECAAELGDMSDYNLSEFQKKEGN